MPVFMRAIAVLPALTSVPEDASVNVWHFEADDDVDTPYQDVADILEDFYIAVKGLLSPLVGTAPVVKVYDLSDDPIRAPRIEHTWFLDIVGGDTPLPNEIAMVSSFQGAGGSGINIRRRRGRIFLGPLRNGTLQSSGSRAEFTNAALGTLAAAAEVVADNSLHNGVTQAVFSTTTSPGSPVTGGRVWTGAELAAGFNDVVEGWVDNAPDVQRRRGIKADTRTNWSI